MDKARVRFRLLLLLVSIARFASAQAPSAAAPITMPKGWLKAASLRPGEPLTVRVRFASNPTHCTLAWIDNTALACNAEAWSGVGDRLIFPAAQVYSVERDKAGNSDGGCGEGKRMLIGAGIGGVVGGLIFAKNGGKAGALGAMFGAGAGLRPAGISGHVRARSFAPLRLSSPPVEEFETGTVLRSRTLHELPQPSMCCPCFLHIVASVLSWSTGCRLTKSSALLLLMAVPTLHLCAHSQAPTESGTPAPVERRDSTPLPNAPQPAANQIQAQAQTQAQTQAQIHADKQWAELIRQSYYQRPEVRVQAAGDPIRCDIDKVTGYEISCMEHRAANGFVGGILHARQQYRIPRREIRNVRVAGREISTLVGAGVGVGVGVGVGSINQASRADGAQAIFALLFGGLGALIGHALPVAGRQVYQQP